MESQLNLTHVPDDALVRRLGELVSQSRRVEADLVAHIGEVEARRLYAREASPSMFAYCTERLHLSEAEAYARIRVARAARRHPVLLAMLRDGQLHLSGLVRLVPHLTAENRNRLLERAVHKSKRQIEELVAELFPLPDVPTVVRSPPVRRAAPESSAAPGPGDADAAARELCPGTVASASPPPAPLLRQPGASTASVPVTVSTPSRPAVIEPLAPARYKVQFTASAELRRKLERLQTLMRSEVPDGDLAAIIERAVSEKLERLEARRYAKTSAPRKELSDSELSPASRHIPAAVRRAVLERDGSRCGYVDEQGRRCTERDRLEFHHRHPFGMGGDHRPTNIGLLCPVHNRLLAEKDYGVAAVSRRRVITPTRPVAKPLIGGGLATSQVPDRGPSSSGEVDR